MTPPERFPYIIVEEPTTGQPGQLPYLPIRLSAGGQVVIASGLLDTGSAINVLPYDVGLRLGFAWEDQRSVVRLTGNFTASEARGVLLQGIVGSFPPVRLAFAWTRAEQVPVILGQVNFFLEFDVCFFRHRFLIEVKPRAADRPDG